MVRHISATELGRSLADVLSRVQYKGEALAIERNRSIVGVLRPPAADGLTWHQLVDLLQSGPTCDDRFADDLERVQRE